MPRGMRPMSVMSILMAGTLVSAACSDNTETPAPVEVNDPLVATYDGGLYVLDGETLDVQQDIAMDGFLRLNPAGDDAHVLVSAPDGFRVLNAAAGELTDHTFAASEPGHVVRHGHHTVLFADGSGEITAFDPHDLGDGAPPTETFQAAQPHHGVAVLLDDETLVHSVGDPDSRTGAAAFDSDGNEIARSGECPGLHGEGMAAGETVVFGCQNGALVYADGAFTKISSPGPYGRIGNFAGNDGSPVVLADFKVDPDAELERPGQFALIDTASQQLELVQLPPGVSYSFRSLARGPQAQALVLGTDGNLYVIDPATGDTVKTVEVTGEWSEPQEWQKPRPTVFARDAAVYVTDPAAKQIHRVDLASGAVTASTSLEQRPNELSGTIGHDH